MYSEIVNDSGISQHTLEVIVLAGIGVFVLGLIFFLWWKQIMIGSLALVAVVVMANHKPTVAPKVEQEKIIIDDKDRKTPPVVAPKQEEKEELVIEPQPDENKEAFMEDCLTLTDYTKAKCESIWNKKEDDVPKT